MPCDLGALAGALLLTGAGIVRWQRRAAACPRHRRWAGHVAWALAGLCLAGAAALLGIGLAA